MSTLTVGTIQSNTTLPPVVENSAGTEIGTFCRAWVNFNGTGTVAIRAAFNVSSITDNGTGDYTVNFGTAMADANYSTNINASNSSQANWVGINYTAAAAEVAPTTAAVRFGTTLIGTGARDQKYLNVAIFR